jgi:CBS domain-containing protein
MAKITPSPAISVTTHTTIGQTLSLMRQSQVGAVLVTDYQQPHRLVGIFTERDLLNWSLELQKHESWNQSIATVMTKNPTCLDVSQLHLAPEAMAQLGKRHLPITFQDPQGQTYLAGVISMRDLFYQFVNDSTQGLDSISLKKPIVTPSVWIGNTEARSLALQKSLLEPHYKLVTELEPAPVQVAILDLDSLTPAQWSHHIKLVRDAQPKAKVLVLYQPNLHSGTELMTLDQLSQGGAIERVLKPIHVLEYLKLLQKLTQPA